MNGMEQKHPTDWHRESGLNTNINMHLESLFMGRYQEL